MNTYCHISAGTVDNRAVFDTVPPNDWPDLANWIASEEAQIGWTYADNAFSAPPVPPAPPVDLTAYLANARWMRQTGGYTINGEQIRTDEASQNLLMGACFLLTQNPALPSVNFKAVTGYVTIPRDQMLAIGTAIGMFIQACFNAENLILADITAGTITTTEQIDTDTRWPANG